VLGGSPRFAGPDPAGKAQHPRPDDDPHNPPGQAVLAGRIPWHCRIRSYRPRYVRKGASCDENAVGAAHHRGRKTASAAGIDPRTGMRRNGPPDARKWAIWVIPTRVPCTLHRRAESAIRSLTFRNAGRAALQPLVAASTRYPPISQVLFGVSPM